MAGRGIVIAALRYGLTRAFRDSRYGRRKPRGAFKTPGHVSAIQPHERGITLNTVRGALRLTGRAQQRVEVATLARAVARGEVIKHADVVMQRRPRAELSRDAVTDRDQAVGLAARNALQAGHFLRSIDLMKPEIVQRNETVMLIYEVPGITLTARGKALDSGAEGDTIPVLNEQSRRTIQAVVIGPGRAAIMTGVPKLAANIAPTGTPAPAQ